jgi:hypothetical protein
VLIERWAASAGDPASLDPAHAIYTLPQAAIPYALFDQLMTYDKDRREHRSRDTSRFEPALRAS